jgi:ABC-type transport system involved in multi-copper enzyme maturation permease subunit
MDRIQAGQKDVVGDAPIADGGVPASARRTRDRAPSTVTVLGALVRRDLMRNLRQVRAFIFLVLAVGTLSLFIVGAWPDQSYTLSWVTRHSRLLIMLFGFIYLSAAGIVLPAYGAMAIVQEREQQTLELLNLTLIPPWGLLLGKLLNTLGLYLLLVVAGMPVIGLLFCLVGLDLIVLAKAILVLLTASISIAMLSVVWSIRARRGTVALIRAYLSMLFVMGAHLIPIVIIMEVTRFRPAWRLIEALATVMSPFFCLGTMAEGRVFHGGFLLSIVYQLTLAFCAFLAAMWLMRRPLEPSTPRKHRAAKQRPLTRALDIILARVPPFRSIRDWSNPVYRAEVQWSPLTKPSGRRRIFLFLLFLGLGLAVFLIGSGQMHRGSSNDGLLFWIMAHVTFVCAVAPALTANMLTKERDLANLDMLRMTLLTPRDIVLGKTRAAIAGVAPVLLAAALASIPLLPGVFLVRDGEAILVTGLVMAGLCGLVAVCFSMLASMLVKRSTTAVVLSYALTITFIFLLYPGWEIGLELLREFARAVGGQLRFSSGGPVARRFMWLSPVYAFVEKWFGRNRPDISYWWTNVITNLVICALLAAATVKGFARRYMREK